MSLTNRTSGILLHPSSLPGAYGTGEIGQAAFDFIDHLRDMGQKYWQLLPLNPIGPCASPYSSSSSGACSDLLVSVEKLVEAGYLTQEDIAPLQELPNDRVDFGWLVHLKPAILDKAADNFAANASDADQQSYEEFCAANSALWLDDYALFCAIHRDNDYINWTEWDSGLATRTEAALDAAKKHYASQVKRLKIRQYFFDQQWRAVRDYAAEKGIEFIGDIPIFVSHDSADVWANQHLFKLKEDGRPWCVTGVPPDIFSETGQRWGNPHYDWDAMKSDGFRWWKQRMHRMIELCDIVRIDHFLAFNSAWQIPAEEPTAIKGHWEPAPGHDLFQAFKDEFGELPLIAEDLGIITEGVIRLRDSFNIPGLHILQFEINDPDKQTDSYLAQSVTYTGTHDNNTSIGWFLNEGRAALSPVDGEAQRQKTLAKLGGDGSDINWRMINHCMQSPSNLVLFPLQDVLDLGVEGRMNVPGTAEHNWEWRYGADQLTAERKGKMLTMTLESGRG